MNKSPLVSIIIVDFFKAKRVVENVKGALKQMGNFTLEVFVIDNSCDICNCNTLKALDDIYEVTVIINKTNLGYIKATNQGGKYSRGDYILLVNPDIVWKYNDIIQNIINKFNEDKSTAIIGTRQENDDGTTPDTVRRFPDLLAQFARRTFLRKLPFFRHRVKKYEMNEFDYSISTEVDWVQSSFMAIKHEFWQEVRGLDEAFFLFMSDPDICYKAWENGYKVSYLSEVIVGADGKRCSAGGLISIFTSKAVRYHIIDAIVYYMKYRHKKVILLDNNN